MASYNKLASVVVNENITAWRFRVKLIRIHSNKIPSLGHNEPPYTVWSYVLANEAGSKIEVHIYPADTRRFKGLEKGEGKWVEIFRVQVVRAFTPFKPANSRCRLVVFEGTVIKPIEPLNNHHYMDFKCLNDNKYINDRDSLVEGFQIKWFSFDVFFPKREFQLKCVATGDNAYAFQEDFAKMRGRGVVVAVLMMWRPGGYIPGFEEPWIETYKGFSTFSFNSRMEEVDSFMKND